MILSCNNKALLVTFFYFSTPIFFLHVIYGPLSTHIFVNFNLQRKLVACFYGSCCKNMSKWPHFVFFTDHFFMSSHIMQRGYIFILLQLITDR